MRIRRASVSDLDALLSLHQEMHALHAAAVPAHFRRDPPAAEVVAAFLRGLDDPAALWLIAEDDAPVGYLFASFHDVAETWVRPALRLCEINHLTVRPKSRRRGVARRLLAALVETAAQRGFERIGLEVWRFNEDARRAFARLDFHAVSERLERPCRRRP